MKHLLLTTIAAVMLVVCVTTQKSLPLKTQSAEVAAEATQLGVPTAKAPDIPLLKATKNGNTEAVKQHLASGADVNAIKDGVTPLMYASAKSQKEIVEFLIASGADVNPSRRVQGTPLMIAANFGQKEILKHYFRKAQI